MSEASLWRAIVAELQTALNEPKIKKADIMEWSTSPITPKENEKTVQLKTLGYVAYIWPRMKKPKPDLGGGQQTAIN